MVGKEAEDLDTRHIFDTTLTFAATEKLSLMGNFDYGKEGDVEWWGIAAYAKLQATPSWAVAARYEYLDDTKGGFMTFGTKAQTITVTSDHTIAGALKARLEYRTDFADEDIFETDDGSFEGSQTTLTVGRRLLVQRRAVLGRGAPVRPGRRPASPLPRSLRPEPAAVLLERLAGAGGLEAVEERSPGEAPVEDRDGQDLRLQPGADPLPVAGLHPRVLRHRGVVRLEEPRREVRLGAEAMRPASELPRSHLMGTHRFLALFLLLGGAATCGGDTFDGLVDNLKSPTARTRQEAARQLGESRRREAVAPLSTL